MERGNVKDQLEGLVSQMVERGILFDEAVGEFEKRFIKRVLERGRGQPVARRGSSGNPPQHTEPQDRRIQAGSQRTPPLALRRREPEYRW